MGVQSQMAQHRPKSRQTSSGLSAAGQNIVGGNKTYGGGALGLQNKAGFHQDPNEQALSDKYPVDIDKIIHESRMKNMARNLPKKQGRMFGIELGQNVRIKDKLLGLGPRIVNLKNI